MYVREIKKNIFFLLYAWVDSLKIFWSGQAQSKLMLFGIYRAFIHTYRILFSNFWLLMITMFFGALYVPFFIFFNMSGLIIGVLTVLAARPSVGQKTYRYFLNYWYVFFIAATLALFFYLFEQLLADHVLSFFSLATGIFSPLYLTCLFFVSDSMPFFYDIQLNIWNGIKMVLYNYPLFLLIYLVLYILWSLLFFIINIVVGQPFSFTSGLLLNYIFIFLLSPGYVCLVSTAYLQRRYEQRDLYL